MRMVLDHFIKSPDSGSKFFINEFRKIAARIQTKEKYQPYSYKDRISPADQVMFKKFEIDFIANSARYSYIEVIEILEIFQKIRVRIPSDCEPIFIKRIREEREYASIPEDAEELSKKIKLLALFTHHGLILIDFIRACSVALEAMHRKGQYVGFDSYSRFILQCAMHDSASEPHASSPQRMSRIAAHFVKEFRNSDILKKCLAFVRDINNDKYDSRSENARALHCVHRAHLAAIYYGWVIEDKDWNKVIIPTLIEFYKFANPVSQSSLQNAIAKFVEDQNYGKCSQEVLAKNLIMPVDILVEMTGIKPVVVDVKGPCHYLMTIDGGFVESQKDSFHKKLHKRMEHRYSVIEVPFLHVDYLNGKYVLTESGKIRIREGFRNLGSVTGLEKVSLTRMRSGEEEHKEEYKEERKEEMKDGHFNESEPVVNLSLCQATSLTSQTKPLKLSMSHRFHALTAPSSPTTKETTESKLKLADKAPQKSERQIKPPEESKEDLEQMLTRVADKIVDTIIAKHSKKFLEEQKEGPSQSKWICFRTCYHFNQASKNSFRNIVKTRLEEFYKRKNTSLKERKNIRDGKFNNLATQIATNPHNFIKIKSRFGTIEFGFCKNAEAELVFDEKQCTRKFDL